MSAPKFWGRFSLRTYLAFDVSVDAESETQARRFAAIAMEGAEVAPGYANGEQAKIDGGVSVVSDDVSRLIEAARMVSAIRELPHGGGYFGTDVQAAKRAMVAALESFQ